MHLKIKPVSNIIGLQFGQEFIWFFNSENSVHHTEVRGPVAKINKDVCDVLMQLILV